MSKESPEYKTSEYDQALIKKTIARIQSLAKGNGIKSFKLVKSGGNIYNTNAVTIVSLDNRLSPQKKKIPKGKKTEEIGAPQEAQKLSEQALKDAATDGSFYDYIKQR